MTVGEEEARRIFRELLAIGRVCMPNEVAEALVWLSLDCSSFVNGTTLTRDGGGEAVFSLNTPRQCIVALSEDTAAEVCDGEMGCL